MTRDNPRLAQKLRAHIIDVLEFERERRGMSEGKMGKAIGLSGRRGYSHMRREAKEPPKYETLVMAAKNLQIVFEHEGLVFGPREKVTPSFLKKSIKKAKKP